MEGIAMKDNARTCFRIGPICGFLLGLLVSQAVLAGNTPVSNWMVDLTAEPPGSQSFDDRGAEMVVVSKELLGPK